MGRKSRGRPIMGESSTMLIMAGLRSFWMVSEVVGLTIAKVNEFGGVGRLRSFIFLVLLNIISNSNIKSIALFVCVVIISKVLFCGRR